MGREGRVWIFLCLIVQKCSISCWYSVVVLCVLCSVLVLLYLLFMCEVLQSKFYTRVCLFLFLKMKIEN